MQQSNTARQLDFDTGATEFALSTALLRPQLRVILDEKKLPRRSLASRTASRSIVAHNETWQPFRVR